MDNTKKFPWLEPLTPTEMWLMLDELYLWRKKVEDSNGEYEIDRRAAYDYFNITSYTERCLQDAFKWIENYGDPREVLEWRKWKELEGHEVVNELREGLLLRNVRIEKISAALRTNRPWKRRQALPQRSIDIWCLADKVYDWWKDAPTYIGSWGQTYGNGYSCTARAFFHEPSGSWQSLIKYLREYGDPRNDEEWLEFKRHHDKL